MESVTIHLEKSMNPFDIQPETRTSDFIYCYKSVKSSLYTISSKSLRFSPLSSLNDPLEQAFTLFYLNKDKQVENVDELTTLLKQQTALYCENQLQVLCFTQDKQFTWDTLPSQANRGFMRFRMWSQYADNGEGACFIFDKSTFDKEFIKISRNMIFGGSGSVKYTDDYRERSTAHEFSISELLAMKKGNDIFSDKIKKYYQFYLLTKRTDWEQEREFRYFVVQNNPVYIDISKSLVGITLGYNHSKEFEKFVLKQFPDPGVKKVKIILQGFHAYLKGIHSF